MKIERAEAAQLLSLNKFNVDEEEPHIVLNKDICRQCSEETNVSMFVRPYCISWIRTGDCV